MKINYIKVISIIATCYGSIFSAFSMTDAEIMGVIASIDTEEKKRNLRTHVNIYHLPKIDPITFDLTSNFRPKSYFSTPDIRIISDYINTAIGHARNDPIAAHTKRIYDNSKNSIQIVCDLGPTGSNDFPNHLGVDTLNSNILANHQNTHKICIGIKYNNITNEWYFATAIPMR